MQVIHQFINIIILSVAVYTPVDRFVNDSLDYFDLQRVGGLKSHLNKVHENVIKESGILSQPSNAPLGELLSLSGLKRCIGTGFVLMANFIFS